MQSTRAMSCNLRRIEALSGKLQEEICRTFDVTASLRRECQEHSQVSRLARLADPMLGGFAREFPIAGIQEALAKLQPCLRLQLSIGQPTHFIGRKLERPGFEITHQ